MYVAPEVCGKHKITPAFDVWALGVCTLEALTGLLCSIHLLQTVIINVDEKATTLLVVAFPLAHIFASN